MKVTLDLSRLRAEGSITPEEYERLLALSAREGAGIAVNILIGFGVVSVSAAALALVPDALVAIGLGAGLLIAGAGLLVRAPAWTVLGNILLLVAALLFGGGLLTLMSGTLATFLLVAAVFAGVALLTDSALMTVLAVLMLSGALGSRGAYAHALYSLSVPQPTVTVVLFTALAIALYGLSRRVGARGERISLIGARTALFLVNLGFWVGSLWGDRLGPDGRGGGVVITDLVFVLGWLIALAGVGAWAVRENRRWVLNLAAVFGAIHFYTQWFERLGATPLSVLVAGLVLLGLAFGLWRWNDRFPGGGPSQPGSL